MSFSTRAHIDLDVGEAFGLSIAFPIARAVAARAEVAIAGSRFASWSMSDWTAAVTESDRLVVLAAGFVPRLVAGFLAAVLFGGFFAAARFTGFLGLAEVFFGAAFLALAAGFRVFEVIAIATRASTAS